MIRIKKSLIDLLIYVLFFSALCVVYLLGVVPDTEEYITSLPSTWLGQNLILNGNQPDWSWRIGFGAPVKFSHHFIYNPIFYLFNFFPSSFTLKLIILFHAFIGGLFFNKILILFNVDRLVRYIGILSYFLCSSVHSLLFSNVWLNEFFVYFFWPIVLWSLINFFRDSNNNYKNILLNCIILIFIAMTLYFNGHISHTLSFILPTFIFIFFYFFNKENKIKWVIFILIGLITFILLVPHLLSIYYEYLQFHNDSIRKQENFPLSPLQTLWVASSKPFCYLPIVNKLNYPHGCLGSEFLSTYNPFIGIPFILLFLIYTFTLFLKQIKIKISNNDSVYLVIYLSKKLMSEYKLSLSLFFSSISAFILIFVDIKSLGDFFSISHFFKDSFHIFSICFICVSLTSMKYISLKIIIIFLQTVSLLVAIYQPINRNISNQQFQGLDPLDEILEENFLTEQLKFDLDEGFKRVMFSSHVNDLVINNIFLRSNKKMIENSNLFHDLNLVNVKTKGVSLDIIQKSDIMMYGNFYPQDDINYHNSIFLSQLGIKYLLTLDYENIYGNWSKVFEINLNADDILILYKNNDYSNTLSLLKNYDLCDGIDLNCIEKNIDIEFDKNTKYKVDYLQNKVIVDNTDLSFKQVLLPIMTHKYLIAKDNFGNILTIPEKSVFLNIEIPKNTDYVEIYFQYPWDIYNKLSIFIYFTLFLIISFNYFKKLIKRENL